MQHNNRRGNAFTLVELLVVIAIIALLMGMLLPVLNRAREAGRSIMCASNLRSISMAGTIYAFENDGSLPPYRMRRAKPADPDSSYVNRYGRVKPRWQWFFNHGIGPVIDPSPYVHGTDDTFGDDDTLIMTNDYFMCPSFRSEFDRRDIRNGSYGYNYQYLGNPRLTEDGTHSRNFPVYTINIRRQSETIIVADSRGGNIGNRSHGKHSYTMDPPKIARSVNANGFGYNEIGSDITKQHSPAEARHSGKVNVSFLDGHVEKLSLEKLGYVLDSDGIVIADDPRGNNRMWSKTGRDEP